MRKARRSQRKRQERLLNGVIRGRAGIRQAFWGTMIVTGLITFTSASAEGAASPPFDIGRVQSRPGSERLIPLPDLNQPAKTVPMDLPPLPVAPAGDGSPITRIRINKIIISGSTIFSIHELAAMAAPYEARAVSYEELEQLRYDLTRRYIDAGYINSGAVIPDQEVQNGVVHLQVVEGRLTEVQVAKGKWLRPRYIRRRIERAADVPLNINRLQEDLSVLQQDPLIERLHAQLKPGLRPGESILDVRVDEAGVFELGVGLDNRRSPTIGAERFHTWGTVRNLTGWGDALGLSYGLTEGLDDINLFYAVPVNAYDTRVNLRYSRSDARVIERPFDRLDIQSEAETFGIDIRQPLYRTPYQSIAATVTMDRRSSLTQVFGELPFAFSEGVPNFGPNKGRTVVSVLRFTLDGQTRSQTEAFALRSQFSVGLDMLDATINKRDATGLFGNCFNQTDCPDGRYFGWLGQLQWAKRLPWLNSDLIARADISLSNRPLLPMEKFSIGGATTVRGYRENYVVADNGWESSLELRIPIGRVSLPLISDRPSDGVVQIAPFFDAGGGWNHISDSSATTIYSVGIGLRWDPTTSIHSELYWGKALTPAGDADRNLQDDGIHFQVLSQLF